MKKITLTILIVIAAVVAGCQSDSGDMKKPDAFATELQNLYNRDFSLISDTRTADGAPMVNEEACNLLDQTISDIISDYNILEETQNSGYYNNLMSYDINSIDGFDFYDFLNFVSKEGTPAMQQLMNQIIYDDDFNIESVINHDKMLSFEKLILVASFTIIKDCDDSLIIETRSAATDKCIKTYDSDVKRCKNSAFATVGLGLVTGIFTGGATAVAGTVVAATGYALCKGDVSKKLDVCLQLATEI